MLLGENLRKIHQAQQPQGAGAAMVASWLAPATRQVTRIKRLFAHVVILGTTPHARTHSAALGEPRPGLHSTQSLPDYIPTENKKQA